MSDLATEFKPYFAYADELRSVAPVISYYCDWLGTSLTHQKLQGSNLKFKSPLEYAMQN